MCVHMRCKVAARGDKSIWCSVLLRGLCLVFFCVYAYMCGTMYVWLCVLYLVLCVTRVASPSLGLVQAMSKMIQGGAEGA